MTTHPPLDEPRWAGAREVTVMAGPIVLSMISYTVMETLDQVMAAQLGTAELAAMGTAPVFTYLIAATMLGIVTCVSTFVSQSIGRGHPEHSASYTWQGVHFGVLAGVLSLAAWPLALPLFSAMGHTAQVAGLEADYFQVRLIGFMPLVWIWAFMTFFMAIERPNVPMYIAIVGNLVNLVLNYMLIFGEWGAPQLGVAGAAWGTVVSQWLQAGLFFWVFLTGKTKARFATRTAWPLHWKRLRESLRESVGGTYSVGVFGNFAREPVERYATGAAFVSDPARVEGLVDLALQEIGALRQSGPAEAELDRVRELQRREYEEAIRRNGYWLGSLARLAKEGRDWEEILEYPNRIEKLDTETIRMAARAFTSEENMLLAILDPELE